MLEGTEPPPVAFEKSDYTTLRSEILRHPINQYCYLVNQLKCPKRLSENGYFSQSLRQAQIIILEILKCIPVVIIFAFLDPGKNISFSDSLLSFV